MDGVQYIFYFVPDYSEQESLLIFKSHHCFCDGIATLVLTSSLTEEYSPSLFSKLSPPFSCIDTIMKYITLPFSMAFAFRSLFIYRERSNEINNKSKLTGKRKVAYSKPLNIDLAF